MLLVLILALLMLALMQLLASAAVGTLPQELLLQQSCSSMDWHALLLLLLSTRACRLPAAGNLNMILLQNRTTNVTHSPQPCSLSETAATGEISKSQISRNVVADKQMCKTELRDETSRIA